MPKPGSSVASRGCSIIRGCRPYCRFHCGRDQRTAGLIEEAGRPPHHGRQQTSRNRHQTTPGRVGNRRRFRPVEFAKTNTGAQSSMVPVSRLQILQVHHQDKPGSCMLRSIMVPSAQPAAIGSVCAVRNAKSSAQRYPACRVMRASNNAQNQWSCQCAGSSALQASGPLPLSAQLVKPRRNHFSGPKTADQVRWRTRSWKAALPSRARPITPRSPTWLWRAAAKAPAARASTVPSTMATGASGNGERKAFQHQLEHRVAVGVARRTPGRPPAVRITAWRRCTRSSAAPGGKLGHGASVRRLAPSHPWRLQNVQQHKHDHRRTEQRGKQG